MEARCPVDNRSGVADFEPMFKPTADPETLKQRASIINSIREFFSSRDFVEVETPALSHDVVVDRYLDPIPVDQVAVTMRDSDRDRTMWLQTSPEFGMKRLVAAGMERIFQITHAFRAGEIGRLHNPEFTMLEWYRVGDSQATAIEFLGELARATLPIAHVDRVTYGEAFLAHAGLDPFQSDVDEFASVCRQQGLDIELFLNEQDLDFWRNLVLTHIVEPKLGRDAPVVVYDWPASQSALAVVRNEVPAVAERFELFYRGIELANGYHELLDPDELCRRNRHNNELRQLDGKRPLPESSRLLKAMEAGLPDCCGVALGIDRLVMLALGKNSLAEIMAFPFERA